MAPQSVIGFRTVRFKRPRRVLNAGDLYPLVRRFSDQKREHLVVVHLDADLKAVRYHVAAVGSMRDMTFEIHDVFRLAIRRESKSLIMVHNHPYQEDVKMSNVDKEMTKTLYESGLILHIPVLDHVIVGTESYISCRARGIIMPKSETYELDDEFRIFRHKKAGGAFTTR